MRQKQISVFLLAVLMVMLASCIEQPMRMGERVRQPIKIGTNPWCACMFWAIAQEKGFFEKRNVDVEIVQFDSWHDSIEAFNKGKVDGVQETLSSTMVAAVEGKRPRKIVAVVDVSWADGIVARKEFLTIADLRGSRIAVEAETEDYYMLLFALQEVGLKKKDVHIFNADWEQALAGLKSGQFDAIVTWEPYLTAAADGIEGNILYTSRNLRGFFVDDLVFSPEALKTRKKDIVQLMYAWFDALAYYEDNRDEAIGIMAKAQGVTPAEFGVALGKVGLYRRDAAYETLTSPELVQEMRVLAAALQSIGVLHQAPEPETLIDVSVMEKVGPK